MGKKRGQREDGSKQCWRIKGERTVGGGIRGGTSFGREQVAMVLMSSNSTDEGGRGGNCLEGSGGDQQLESYGFHSPVVFNASARGVLFCVAGNEKFSQQREKRRKLFKGKNVARRLWYLGNVKVFPPRPCNRKSIASGMENYEEGDGLNKALLS